MQRSSFSSRRPEVVVVTGASAGVGRAIACEFARRGAHLGLVARGADRLADARCEVESLGGRAIAIAGDVADPATTERIAALTTDAFGPIDVWINNAMVSVYSPIWEMPPEEFQRVTAVTYLGCVYGTQAALRRMLPRNAGTIVQIGSSLAYRSIPHQSAYCAAKHAIHGFTDSLRSELIAAHKRLRVTMVQLPSMNTPQFLWAKNRLGERAKPPAPIYQPEVAARAVYWAAHHDRREVYVGALTSVGIKLNKLVPSFLDRFLVGRSFGHTHQPPDPQQPDNLFEPAPNPVGAHGPFDSDAQSRSLQVQLTTHRGAVLAGLGLAGAIALALAYRRRSRRPGSWLRRSLKPRSPAWLRT